MTDAQAVKLARLLADYAEAYGADCDGDITVKVLADDLVEANTDPVLTNEIETLRDRIYDGLNQHRNRGGG